VVGAILDLLQQRGVILGVRLVAAAEVEAELGEEAAQRGELLRRRAFVDAEQRRLLILVQDNPRRRRWPPACTPR
jgi:hypothetical protein